MKEKFSGYVSSYVSLVLLQVPQLTWKPCARTPALTKLHSTLVGSGFVIMLWTLVLVLRAPVLGGAGLTDLM